MAPAFSGGLERARLRTRWEKWAFGAATLPILRRMLTLCSSARPGRAFDLLHVRDCLLDGQERVALAATRSSVVGHSEQAVRRHAMGLGPGIP